MATLAEQLAQAKAEEARADQLNAIIDDVANELINGNPKQSAQALENLAYFCKASEDLFMQMRRLAVTKAIAQSDELFIMEKLKLAEQDKRDERRIKH